MLLIWLVVAAFLYWPFRQWDATYKAPLISALLWPLMILFFIGFAIWARFFDKENSKTKSYKFKNEKKDLQEAGGILAKNMLKYAPTHHEKIALAKQLLIHSEIDLKHEYYYPKGIFNKNLKDDIKFGLYSEKFKDFYSQHQQEAIQHEELLKNTNYKDYDPREHSDKDLNNLDLFEIVHVFNSMVNRFDDDPKVKFMVKLLIIDNMIK